MALMEPHCFGKKSDPGRRGGGSHFVMETVLWIAGTGAPWRDLPLEFGNWLRENLAKSGNEPVIPPK
jgi:transposase